MTLTIPVYDPRTVYLGTGSTGPLNIPGEFVANSHVRIKHRNTSLVEIYYVEGSDYTISSTLDGDKGTYTGTLTLTVALATGEKLAVWVDDTLSQDRNLAYGGSFDSKTIIRGLNKLTRLLQQHDDRLDRALLLNVFDESFDAGGLVVKNAGNAVDDGDLVPKGQIPLLSDLQAQASAAAASAAAAEAAFDNFDDRSLGQKASDPLVDNDGDPLQDGTVYFNTTDDKWRSYSGGTWSDLYPSGVVFSVNGESPDGSGNVSVPSVIASVTDYGAVAGDNSAAVQSANVAAFAAAMVAHKSVFVPEGTFYTDAPVVIQQSGQKLIGSNGYNSSILPQVTSIDTINSSAHSDVEISNIWIYVNTGGVGYRHYGGAWLNLHDCTFLAITNGSGTGIILDDRDGAAVLVPGSYFHNIHDNIMSRGSDHLNIGVQTAGTSGGINASSIVNNKIISDRCVEWNGGGGNHFTRNTFQSSTGTTGTPSGYGIVSNSTHSSVHQNYMERFLADFLNNSTTTGSAPDIVGHHSDNSTAILAFGSTTADSSMFIQRAEGIDAFGLKPNAISVTANSQVIQTNHASILIEGNGATYSACTLSIDNARDGQIIHISGDSWAVQIDESTTADFGPHGSTDGMIFGGVGAAIAIDGVTRPTYRNAIFKYSSDVSKWLLIDATTHGPQVGNFEYFQGSSNGEVIPTSSATVYLNGNGAARVTCTLEAPVVEGQMLTLVANSWSISFVPSTTAHFKNGVASATFGSGAGQFQAMQLIGLAGIWYQSSEGITYA